MLPEQTKRLLLIIGFLVSVVAIAFALYFAFFRIAPAPIEQTQTPVDVKGTTGGLKPSQTGAPSFKDQATEPAGLTPADEVALGDVTQTTQLTSAPIFNPSLASDGARVNFYDPQDEKFYRIANDGEIEALSDERFPSLDKATWDRSSEKAVLEFPDGSNIVYDFENETRVTLPKHWEDFDFSPTTDELIAKSIGIDPQNRWLVISNANGSNVKSIQALGDNEHKVQASWSPNNQVVAFSDTAEGIGSFDRRNIIPLGKEQENFKALTVEGLGFKSQWAPDGKKLLYSVSGSYSNYRPLLWVVDGTGAAMGENRRSLSLNTWADKCTFASDAAAICAVPQGLPANAGLQPELFSDIADALYEININTGATKLLAIPESDHVMSDLFITKDQSLVYFRDANTGQLSSIKLK